MITGTALKGSELALRVGDDRYADTRLERQRRSAMQSSRVERCANFSHGKVRDSPDLAFALDVPSVGKVTLDQAEARAASNIAEFERIATGVKVDGLAVTPVWLDRDSNLFALRIQLHVAHATTVTKYLGDLVSGPATGLIGDEKTVIGGLAITVTDDAGRSSGWWQTAQGSIGIGTLGPR